MLDKSQSTAVSSQAQWRADLSHRESADKIQHQHGIGALYTVYSTCSTVCTHVHVLTHVQCSTCTGVLTQFITGPSLSPDHAIQLTVALMRKIDTE